MIDASLPLTLDSRATLIVVIDPQVGFSSPSGTLGRVFGPHELTRVGVTVNEIRRFLAKLPTNAEVAIVRSEYPEGLHTGNISSDTLSTLCVIGTPDCELAYGFAGNVDWQYITKNTTDAWSVPEFRMAVRTLVERGGKSVVLSGLTVTTCVLQTVLSIRKAFGVESLALVVARDLVGARASSYASIDGKASRVEQAFQEMLAADVTVIPSWRDMLLLVGAQSPSTDKSIE